MNDNYLKLFITKLIATVVFISNILFVSATTVIAAEIGDNVSLTVRNNVNDVFIGYGTDYTLGKYGHALIEYVGNDGNSYPAYCVNSGKWGVENSAAKTYDVNVEKEIDDPKFYAIASNGFPFTNTIGGVTLNDDEAYFATKMALYATASDGANYSDISLWSANPGYANGENVLTAMKHLYNLGASATTIEKSVVTVTPNEQEAIKTGNYFIQTFTVNSNIPFNNYTVSFNGTELSGSTIKDMNGNTTNNFSSGDNFQVVIPETSVPKDHTLRTFELNITTDVAGQTLFYGKAQDDRQSYLMTASTLATENSNATVSVIDREDEITKTDGSLIIYKYENGTIIPLEGAKFEFRDLDGEMSNIYTTDSSGKIVIDNIPDGHYVLKEVQAPKNYVIDYDFLLNVKIDSTTYPDGQQITIHNKKIPKIEVYKVDGKTGTPLADTTFEIAYNDGAEKTTVTTDTNGKATFQPPYIGMYTVTELIAPPGYILNEQPQNVYVDGVEDVVVTFKNYEKTTVRITKHDLADGSLLPSAEFSIVNKDTGELVHEGLTDANGEIIVTDLEAGNYIITEMAPPEHYIKVTESREIKVGEGQDVTVKFDNKLKPSLEISKVDGETGNFLAGATYRVVSEDGSFSSEYTTDSSGKILLQHIPEGVYTVTEIIAPTGYVLNETPKTIHVQWTNDNSFVHTLIFDNLLKGKLTIEKYDESTATLLPNAEFSISHKDTGKIIFEGITDNTGKINLENLQEGWYTVTELAPPEKYMFGEIISKDVHLSGGEDKVIKFDNRLKPSLEITKIDRETSELLENTTFRIEKEDGSFSSEYITDNTGKILLENIDPGVYTVTEIIAPSGYVLNSIPKTIDLQWQSDNTFVHTLIFENYTKPSLIIEKYDEMTNELLANAQFKIEGMDNNFVWEGVLSTGTITSGATQEISGSLEDGRIVINGLDEGTYKITELNPPDGYTFSNTTENPRTVVIEKNKTTTVKIDNRPLPDLEILKIDSVTKEPLANAKFEIKVADGEYIVERQTDSNGKINLTDIDEGTYIITETSAPPNYALNSNNTKTIQIKWNGGDNKDGKYELIFENTLNPTLVINKLSATNGFGLSGAKYEIKFRESDGGLKTLGTYTTNSNGQIVLPYVSAGWYSVTEVKAPAGYSISSNPTKEIYLNLGENSYSDIDLPSEQNDGNITVGNGGGVTSTPSSNEIKVTYGSEIPQIASLFSSQDSIVYNSSIDYENYPLNSIVIKKTDSLTGQLLAGASFDLIKVAEGVSGSGGTTIGSYTTDYTGVIVITGLQSGYYVVKETKAPTNYDLNVTNEQQAFLAEDGTSIVELTFNNYPFGKIVINKMDADTKEPLSNAIFEVTNSKGEYVGSSANGHYSTDVEGSITLENLPPDTYTVTEIKAPNNYAIDQENNVKIINLGYGETKEVDFYNKAFSTLVIRKLDTDTREPLVNAEFKITNSDGTVVGNSNGIFTTDNDGLITIENLPVGSYIITETKAPSNYILDDTTQTIDLNGNSTHTLTFYNTKMSSMQIVKIDSETKEPLKDAQFKIYKANGELVGTYTTDGDGLIILPHLENGWYKAVETKAPNGYQIDDTAKDFEIKGNQFVKLMFENKKLTSLIIKKVAENGGNPLAGAEFKVTRQNGELVGTFTTGVDGTINISELTPDWYVISETKAPSGYLLDETPKTVQVKTNVPTEVTFANKLKSGFQIIKIDSLTGEPLSGTIFTVYKKTGDIVGTYTTDENGVIIVDGLENGWYKIAETKAPIGYKIDETPKDIELKGDEFYKITFANTPLGSLKIMKVNSNTGEPIANVEFEVAKLDGEKVLNEANGTKFITDTTGQIYIPNLENGTYTITETKQAVGYSIDETPKNVVVKAGTPTILEVPNTPLGGLRIEKFDSKTDVRISGVEFEITRKNGEKVLNATNGTIFTTDNNGEIYLSNLENGNYIVTEIKAQEGYKLDTTPKEIEVSSDTVSVLEVKNEPLGGLRIIKTDSQTNKKLVGVEFEITKKNGEKVLNATNGTIFRTDNNGEIYLSNLASGNYIVTETKAQEGYKLDTTPKEIEVSSDTISVLEVKNEPLGGLRIIKTDSQTNKKLVGVEFEIKKENGEKILNETNGTIFTTDIDGEIYLPNLDNGNYIVTETKALNGYFIDTTPKYTTVVTGELTVLEIKNTPASGLVIIKTDERTGRPLQGVEFDILRADGSRVTASILDQNQLGTENNSPNKVINGNGAVNGSYITDSNGKIYLNHLAIGEYHVVETKAQDGYELDQTIHSVTVREGIQEVLKVTNRQKAGLRIKKIDSVTKLPISEVEFRIYDFFTRVEVAGPFYTDNNGNVDITGVLPSGKYSIKETNPAPNYIRDDEPKTIEFKSGVYTEIVWENTPLMGQVQITKKSASYNETNRLPAGTPLADAVFEVYDYKTGNLVEQFKTASNGIGVSKPLPLGRYIIKEVKAPTYYQVSSEELDVTLEFSGQILKYEFTNEPANTGVEIIKTGPNEVIVGQEMMYEFKSIHNKSSIPLSDFFYRDVLPTDAIRLEKIVTGTFNQSVNYKIMYKTNKNDYRVMADNLSSTSNNIVNAQPFVLGLHTDEYVTEIKFIFGEVPAGFKEVEKPLVYAKVLSGLPNGYQFANRSDIGGVYNNEWIISNSTWVTSIYNPHENQYPRTGY